MANEEHLKILRKGVEVWDEWRKHKSGIMPDLNEADLRGTELNQADLSGICMKVFL
jgi:hypothetical protein